ncbi:MAG: hypothetical protein AABY22_36540, partial [Nanoarchaeota archaeon]
MKLLERFRKPTSPSYQYSPTISESSSTKGEVLRNETTFNKEIGDQHIFNLEHAEGMYKNFGLVTGIVDKYVDFVVGPGFTIKTKNSAAK